jgi:hypothetical protein
MISDMPKGCKVTRKFVLCGLRVREIQKEEPDGQITVVFDPCPMAQHGRYWPLIHHKGLDIEASRRLVSSEFERAFGTEEEKTKNSRPCDPKPNMHDYAIEAK